MASPWLGEFLGTMILILLGDGAVAGVLLKRSKAEASGWMVITAGWAFAVMSGVFVAIACGSKDAHLNPAVTLGFAVRDASFIKFAPYLAAQLLGAAAGAALVWLHFFPHWKETPDRAVKLACFCTAPAAGLGAYLVASLVWGVGLSLGGTTGYAINPARDLGPRIAHAILPVAGKGGSDWSYAPIPVIGPLAGGMLAGLLLRFLGIS